MATSTTQEADDQQAIRPAQQTPMKGFMRLPAELRFLVYQELVHDGALETLHAIRDTCRTLHAEVEDAAPPPQVSIHLSDQDDFRATLHHFDREYNFLCPDERFRLDILVKNAAFFQRFKNFSVSVSIPKRAISNSLYGQLTWMIYGLCSVLSTGACKVFNISLTERDDPSAEARGYQCLPAKINVQDLLPPLSFLSPNVDISLHNQAASFKLPLTRPADSVLARWLRMKEEVEASIKKFDGTPAAIILQRTMQRTEETEFQLGAKISLAQCEQSMGMLRRYLEWMGEREGPGKG